MNTNIRKQKQPKHPHHPSNCKAGAQEKAVPFEPPHKAYAKPKSRPLWGKGDRVSGGRGELACYLDCLPTNAPTPTTPTQTKPHQIRGAIQIRKRAPPLRHPNGCHLSPKGEAHFMNHANKIAPNSRGHTTPQASSPSPSPHGPTSPQRARLIVRTTQINHTTHARPYNPASEFPLSDTLTGATSPQRARLNYSP